MGAISAALSRLATGVANDGELVPHQAEQQAIKEMAVLRAQGKPLRAIAEAVRANGVTISHEGVSRVLRVTR